MGEFGCTLLTRVFTRTLIITVGEKNVLLVPKSKKVTKKKGVCRKEPNHGLRFLGENKFQVRGMLRVGEVHT